MENIKDLESIEKFQKDNNIVITTNDLVKLLEQKTGKKWKFKEMKYSYHENYSTNHRAGLVFYNEDFYYFNDWEDGMWHIVGRASHGKSRSNDTPNIFNYLFNNKGIFPVCTAEDDPDYYEKKIYRWSPDEAEFVEKYFKKIQNTNWAVSYISKAKKIYNKDIVNINDNKIGPLIYETVEEYLNKLIKESPKDIDKIEKIVDFQEKNNIVISNNDLASLFEKETGKKWKFIVVKNEVFDVMQGKGYYETGLYAFNEEDELFNASREEIEKEAAREKSSLRMPVVIRYCMESSSEIENKYQTLKNLNWANVFLADSAGLKGKNFHSIAKISDHELWYEFKDMIINVIEKEFAKSSENQDGGIEQH